ncbi:MAG: hypothetical protein ABFD24_12400 [Anaerolineaceae bacterium]
MKLHKYTEQELRFTAVVYASRPQIVEYIRSNGKLPAKIELDGFPIAPKFIARRRGLDPVLSEDEQLVFAAILREKRLPAGGVILFPDSVPIYSLEADQQIEICPEPRRFEWEE